jgi:hypothetical protein
MKITNRMNLPSAIVAACQTDQHNKAGNYSITTLLKGTKEIVLTARHWDELEEDAADSIWKIFGSAVHSVLESNGKDGFAEERMTLEFNGVTITGTIDLYDMARGVIEDYKTASVWKIIVGDFKDWHQQGVGYAWLARNNGLAANACRFTALLKDHKKGEARRDSKYPQSPVTVYEFPVTDADIYDFERFVREKIADIIAANAMPDDEIAPCTAAERWEKETVYAVMKAGRKSSLKNFTDKVEAEKFAADNPGTFIETRPGDSVKCREYCSVCEHCHFYKNMIQEESK